MAHKMAKPWTEDLDGLLFHLCDDGLSHDAIAEQLGRTQDAVRRHLETMAAKMIVKEGTDFIDTVMLFQVQPEKVRAKMARIERAMG